MTIQEAIGKAIEGGYPKAGNLTGIDTDYDGKLFNAELMDFPTKKEVIKAQYDWDYEKSGKNTVAVKIVDVLGEEYFETFEVNA